LPPGSRVPHTSCPSCLSRRPGLSLSHTHTHPLSLSLTHTHPLSLSIQIRAVRYILPDDIHLNTYVSSLSHPLSPHFQTRVVMDRSLTHITYPHNRYFEPYRHVLYVLHPGTHTYINTHIYVYLYIYTYMNILICTNMYINIYICDMYKYVYKHIHMCILTYIQI